VESDNGAVTVIAGAEGAGLADVASINTAKTSAHMTVAMTNDIIDNFLAGSKTIAEFKAAAIVAMMMPQVLLVLLPVWMLPWQMTLWC